MNERWKWLLSRGGVYFAPDEGGNAGGTPPPAPASSGQTPPPAATDEQKKRGDDLRKYDPDKLVEMILELRDENATRRTKLREYESADEKRKREEADAETQRAKQAGDFAKVETKYQTEITTLQTELANARKMIIGLELGLPKDLAARISGTTEEDMRADAAKLKALIAPQQQPATPQKPGARGFSGTTTTAVPGGSPVGETYEQRKQRVYGGSGRTSFGR